MENDDEKLTQIFAALANTTRRAMLASLAEKEATVNQLAEPFNLSLPTISKHIKVLEHAGLITRGHDAQYRPCKINVKPLQAVSDWTEQYRHIWEDRFEHMDDYINQLNKKEEDNE